MIIEMILKNELGEFHSEKMNVTEGQYTDMVEISKSFYTQEGFDMWLEDGFMVVPPDIVKKSILLLKIIEE